MIIVGLSIVAFRAPILAGSQLTLSFAQRVHVGIWYILRAQRGSHIPTLKPKHTPYSYMDPLGWSLAYILDVHGEVCAWNMFQLCDLEHIKPLNSTAFLRNVTQPASPQPEAFIPFESQEKV